MRNMQAFEPLFEIILEVIVSSRAVDPDRVAADLRQIDRAQNGTPGWHQTPACIGVKSSIDRGWVRKFFVFRKIDCGDFMNGSDFGITRRIGMRIERPEPLGEGGVLLGGELLIAKKHDLVLQDRFFDLVTHGIRDRLAKIHAANLRADMRL